MQTDIDNIFNIKLSRTSSFRLILLKEMQLVHNLRETKHMSFKRFTTHKVNRDTLKTMLFLS